MIALLALLSAPAQAAIVDVELCVEFQTAYTDTGAWDAVSGLSQDWWTTNDNRPGRGVWLSVMDWATATEHFPSHYTDWQYGSGGCTTIPMDTNKTYIIFTKSQALVNGVTINAYDDTVTPDLNTYIHELVYTPTGPTTLSLQLPATTLYAQLAAATWVFYRNNPGLTGAYAVIDMYDDDCCYAGDEVHASTFSKTIITHELGHAVGFRREGNNGPQFSYAAPEDGCDGDDVATNKHAQTSKEYQSGAAVEGWADFFSAWAWNKKTESDCVYDRHYSSDFDLDGIQDGTSGKISCEGIPTTGLDPAIDARDWLEDVIDAGFCSAPKTNRGTQYDWLRFWWDMLTDEGISPDTLVDVYDYANPRSWDASGSTGTTSDDPIERIEDACTTVGVHGAWANQKNNGVDH